MTEPRVPDTLKLDDGRSLIMRQATEADMDAIKALYLSVYGGSYTLPEVTDRDKMKWAINDPNYLWILVESPAEADTGEPARLVSSVVFVVDPVHRIGKTFAGLVDPQWRGHHVLTRTLEHGMAHVMDSPEPMADVVYAVVRTLTPRSFHHDLQSVGFNDLGVFPNVRKVRKYETHGLKVRFNADALKQRRQVPRLIPASQQIYAVSQKLLGLEDARVESIRLPRRRPDPGRFQFFVEKSPEVEWEYYGLRDEGKLTYDFFPLHYPQLKLYTRDQRDIVYIHFLETDGHACILGLKTEEEDHAAFLQAVGEMAESLGIKYLELLVSAYDPLAQQYAYDANFLPCAYFPAMKRDEQEQRLDCVVTSCTFVPPHFSGLTLTPESRPYVQAFYKVYIARLWEEIQDS
ncbi:MAG: GNAT family N-acetyltransferase [Candidatus Xenobia bacterium]